jgi:hypothetical protein
VALVHFDASICANDHIICGWLLILLMGTGDPLMPANPLGMGLGQILDPSRVVGLFAGIIYIRGHGFGMAKPSGFEPIAIPSSHPEPRLHPSMQFERDREPLIMYVWRPVFTMKVERVKR